MTSCIQLLHDLEEKAFDVNLAAVYGSDALSDARDRAVQVTRALLDNYNPKKQAVLFSGPGRTEIGGNHTDHQHGHVLCGSVDLDMLACAAPNGLRLVRIRSEGYHALEIELDDLAPKRRSRIPPPPWCAAWRPESPSWVTSCPASMPVPALLYYPAPACPLPLPMKR